MKGENGRKGVTVLTEDIRYLIEYLGEIHGCSCGEKIRAVTEDHRESQSYTEYQTGNSIQ